MIAVGSCSLLVEAVNLSEAHFTDQEADVVFGAELVMVDRGLPRPLTRHSRAALDELDNTDYHGATTQTKKCTDC